MWSNTGSSTCLNPHVHWNQASSSVYEPWRLCNSSLETRRFLSRTNLRKWTGAVKYFNWPAPPPPAVPTGPLTLPLVWPNAAGLQQLSVCLCFVYELILNTLADGGMRFAGDRLMISLTALRFHVCRMCHLKTRVREDTNAAGKKTNTWSRNKRAVVEEEEWATSKRLELCLKNNRNNKKKTNPLKQMGTKNKSNRRAAGFDQLRPSHNND